MARRFKGSNSLKSSRKTFNEKAKYNNDALPKSVLENSPGLFRNFWFIENMYYGKIDRSHNFLIVKPEKLKIMAQETDNTIFLLDFVSEALSDFLKEYKKASSMSKIQKNDDFLSELTVENGHQNIMAHYDLHMTKLRDAVHKAMIKNPSRIENFDDFVESFIEQVINLGEGDPMTFTGYIASRLSTPLGTGLFVDLSSLGYDADADKIDKFIDRPNYKFFMKNCLNYGFMIDYNIPWRLCANLGSVEMERYMLKYGVNSTTIFEEYYDKTFIKDMDYFMNYMLKFYNRFVRLRPYIRREKIINDRGIQVHRYVERRERVTTETLDRKYDDTYRINLYVNLRNYESNDRYDSALLDSIKINANDYLKIEDSNKAYEHINHQFIGFLNDPYAYNGVMMREEAKKNNEQISGQDLQELLNASVAESRETIY